MFDRYLIINKPCDDAENHVSERGIVFRFGIYLEDYLKNKAVFNGYNLDEEYNRNMDAKKILDDFPNGTYPDVIVHLRGSNDYNLLVMEFKPWWEPDKHKREQDILKLKGFTQNPNYSFALGAFISLERHKAITKWFTNGEEINQ